jgi:hypothetical protein
MNIASRFNALIVEWAYAREVMRRLGFSADDLFFMVIRAPAVVHRETKDVTPINGLIVSLYLKAQGKEFQWVVGTTNMSKDKLQLEYERLCTEWNNGIVGDDLQTFKKSKPFKQTERLIKALQDKGFVLGRTDISSN